MKHSQRGVFRENLHWYNKTFVPIFGITSCGVLFTLIFSSVLPSTPLSIGALSKADPLTLAIAVTVSVATIELLVLLSSWIAVVRPHVCRFCSKSKDFIDGMALFAKFHHGVIPTSGDDEDFQPEHAEPGNDYKNDDLGSVFYDIHKNSESTEDRVKKSEKDIMLLKEKIRLLEEKLEDRDESEAHNQSLEDDGANAESK